MFAQKSPHPPFPSPLGTINLGIHPPAILDLYLPSSMALASSTICNSAAKKKIVPECPHLRHYAMQEQHHIPVYEWQYICINPAVDNGEAAAVSAIMNPWGGG